ncbi:MAG TPA: transglycosylase SLT domain-containing protein [Gemmatimonadales bacterium]|nr:transglycosylase SLT domain-containing protein [Gemmatimonadales bacterium]
MTACAVEFLLPWLAAWHLSGHPDALALADAAQMFEVPPGVMFAIADAETRHSTRNTEVSRKGAVGRMQVLPRVWSRRCGPVWGQSRYERNIACGAMILRFYLARCHEEVRCAAWHYVGGDATYAQRVAEGSRVYEDRVRTGEDPGTDLH